MKIVTRALALLALYLGVVLFAGLFWDRQLLLVGLYVAMSALALWAWGSREVVAIFVAGFFLGPAGETVAVRLGAWEYASASGPVPIWLPLAWGLTSIFLLKLSHTITPPARAGDR